MRKWWRFWRRRARSLRFSSDDRKAPGFFVDNPKRQIIVSDDFRIKARFFQVAHEVRLAENAHLQRRAHAAVERQLVKYLVAPFARPVEQDIVRAELCLRIF